MKLMVKLLIVCFVYSANILSYATDPISFALLQKDLSTIIDNQNKANTALNPGVFTKDLEKEIKVWPPSIKAKFISYVNHLEMKKDQDSNDSMASQIRMLPNNDYLLNLVQGIYYNKERSNNFINAGASAQSVVLTTGIASQVNAYNQTNKLLSHAVQSQLNSDWINSINSSTRDQLLRSISQQLSLSNLINYQQLQYQRLGLLEKVSMQMDGSQLLIKLEDILNKQLILYKQLKIISNKLSGIRNQLIKSSS